MSKLICICNRVTEQEVAKVVSRYPQAELQDVINLTAASSSCGRCKTELEDVFNNLKALHSRQKNGAQLYIPFDFSRSLE